MAFSLSEMVAGASKAAGQVGSIFKNPAQAGTDSVLSTQPGIDYLVGRVMIADPTYIPPTFPNPDPAITTPISLSQHITGSVTSITSAISAKTLNVAADLKVALLAASHQDAAKGIDAISSKNMAAIPNQIKLKFPDPTAIQNNVMDTAFTPLTQSASHMNAAATIMSAEFNNVGFMVPFFTAMNAIPGVTQMTTGEQLLKYIGATPDKTLIDSAFIGSTSPAFISGLKTAFSNTGTHTTTMATGFSDIVNSAKGAMATAVNVISGNHLVSMLTSSNPFVKSILDNVIDTSTIDNRAVTLKAEVESKTIALPGVVSIDTAVKPQAEISEAAPDNSITSITTPGPEAPPKVYYTNDETTALRHALDTIKNLRDTTLEAYTTYLKINVEDWKISVGYAAALAAAGYTKEEPYGTTTDRAALDAWKPLLEEQRVRMAASRELYVAYSRAFYTALAARDEFRRRCIYGKYPYSHMKLLGFTFTLEEETTLLDTTK